MEILNYIPVGRKKAITRDSLCIATGLSDRKLREAIEESNVRNKNTPIINLQDGKGYFIPDVNDIEDIIATRKYVKSQESRSSHILRSVEGAKELIENYDIQISD